MAGYCSTAEITSNFKQTTFSSTTAVTIVEVDRWSDEFSRYADGRIVKRFSVPIPTATDGEKIMKLIVCNLTAAKIMRILNATVGVSENELNKATVWEKQAEKWLKEIVKGDLTLPGATELDRLAPKSFNQANAIDPIWESDVDQW